MSNDYGIGGPTSSAAVRYAAGRLITYLSSETDTRIRSIPPGILTPRASPQVPTASFPTPRCGSQGHHGRPGKYADIKQLPCLVCKLVTPHHERVRNISQVRRGFPLFRATGQSRRHIRIDKRHGDSPQLFQVGSQGWPIERHDREAARSPEIRGLSSHHSGRAFQTASLGRAKVSRSRGRDRQHHCRGYHFFSR